MRPKARVYYEVQEIESKDGFNPWTFTVVCKTLAEARRKAHKSTKVAGVSEVKIMKVSLVESFKGKNK